METDISKKLGRELSAVNVYDTLASGTEIAEILDNKIIVIKEIYTDIEHTPVFAQLISHYNQHHKQFYQTIDMLESLSRFEHFFDFVLAQILQKKILIHQDIVVNFVGALRDLQHRYNQTLRSIDRYYDEIVEKVYHSQNLRKSDNKVKTDMYKFLTSYTLMKQAFDGINRESAINENKKERYFSHLKGTMEIVLREFPGANINRIVIALLHDAEEDIEYSKQTIQDIFGVYIADGVHYLSKKDRMLYLDQEEKDLYSKADESQKEELKMMAKEKRNFDYFGHMDQLNDDFLAVKMADRLHNLRTLSGCPIEKIKRKVEETKKYFLHVAKDRMPEAYESLVKEIEKLESGEIKELEGGKIRKLEGGKIRKMTDKQIYGLAA